MLLVRIIYLIFDTFKFCLDILNKIFNIKLYKDIIYIYVPDIIDEFVRPATMTYTTNNKLIYNTYKRKNYIVCVNC